jgi:hypothetical protein
VKRAILVADDEARLGRRLVEQQHGVARVGRQVETSAVV